MDKSENITKPIRLEPEPIPMVCNHCDRRFDICFDVFAAIIACPSCGSTATEVDVEVKEVANAALSNG